jgi:peroxiredoxin
MTVAAPRAPLQPGEPAPDFTLPAVDREGVVSLADYRGKSPVLLAIMRGLWCPFCRRHIAHLGVIRDKLQQIGVETLGIIATQRERARVYLGFHPAHVPLATDPHLEIHHAYGLQNFPVTPITFLKMLTTRVNPTGELPKPTSLLKAGGALNRLDGFEPNDVDRADQKQQATLINGQFMIDRDGVLRWANIEGAKEGLAGIGKMPSDDELLAAARTLTS